MLAALLVACIAPSGFPAGKPEVLPKVKEGQRPAEQGGVAEDPLGCSTPQGTVFGFMKSVPAGAWGFGIFIRTRSLCQVSRLHLSIQEENAVKNMEERAASFASVAASGQAPHFCRAVR